MVYSISASRMSLQFSLLCLLFSVSSCNQGAMQPDAISSVRMGETVVTCSKEQLQSRLDEIHAHGNFPGITAGFAFANSTTLGLAAGLSDRQGSIPMSPQMLLMQGSVGKTYVSAVAMQLISEGTLSLETPISRFLATEEWFSRLPNANLIQLRHLLNHTSGLVRYELNERFIADLGKNPYRVWKPEDRLAYIFDQKAPFLPGQGWTYSDTNYIALGMIIERVTKSSYYEELDKRILTPLGLRHTLPAVQPVIPGLAQGYLGSPNILGWGDAMQVDGKMILSPQWEWTGGGIASTSEDLAKWSKLLYEGQAFQPSLMSEYLRGVPVNERHGPEDSLEGGTKYGLGVFIKNTPFGVAYGHSGFHPGYLTEMLYFPSKKTAIAVQINTTASKRGDKPLITSVYELAGVCFGK